MTGSRSTSFRRDGIVFEDVLPAALMGLGCLLIGWTILILLLLFL